MTSGGHRFMLQREHYQNEDIHLTIACLRARRSQSSLQDVCYEREDRKAHSMPKYRTSSLYLNKSKDIRCRVQENKDELKKRLLHVQRCEAEAEIQRKKRAEQWRQLVLKEEKEEHERKAKIESLQKLIKKEMQQKHHRHHADVNPTYSSMHVQNRHTEFSKLSPCSTATNKPSDSKVVSDALINEQEASLTLEQPERISATVMHRNKSLKIDPPEVIDMHMSNYKIVEDLLPPHKKDDLQLKEAGSTTKNTTKLPAVETDSTGQQAAKTDSKEQTALSSVPTDREIIPHDGTTATDRVELATTVDERDADLPLKDQMVTNSPEELSVTIKEQTDQSVVDTTVGTDSHDDITTATVTTELSQRTSVTTELQIQQTGVVVTKQPEANEESEATITVQITTDVTKTQQYHSKELQAQDTTVSMTQPRATQDSESTLQFTTDSDTTSEPHDTQFWHHPNNTDDIYETPESMSRVFICCHSEYSCVILYLLLYS